MTWLSKPGELTKKSLPASLTILRRVQYLMIIARGRTRSSISTYVLIMRVFSRASVLFTFMSQAISNSGSHILTIGTFATETQTTFSIPPARALVSTLPIEKGGEGFVLLAKRSASLQTLSSSFHGVVMQISTTATKLAGNALDQD